MSTLEERRREDFDFMILCHAKGNAAMYELLRDHSLDSPVTTAQQMGELEYLSWFSTTEEKDHG